MRWVWDSGWSSSTAAAAEGNVDVADDPAVVGAVPAAPEGKGRVVVRHAADHVLWWVDAVHKGPETEEAPGDEELEPDDVEVEEGQHAELEGGEDGPVWSRLWRWRLHRCSGG